MTQITLPISKQILTVKRVLSRKQVVNARAKLAGLLQVSEMIESGKEEDITASAKIVMTKTEEQDELIANTILECFKITQDELDNMPYADALYAYNELFRISQEIPKN